jgi:uncharacterized membrane protein HdeD (DUF308 family)
MNNLETNIGAVLHRQWWLMLLRGIVAIGFGILTFVRPGITLQALVWLFGIYVFIDGILGAWLAIQGRKEVEDWWVFLLWGLAGIVIGVLAFAKPDLTALALLFYIAVWAIATGVLEIVAAVRLRKVISGEWWLILAGLLSVAFGVWLVAQPDKGALAVLYAIGIYAVVFGVLLVILAFRVRSFVSRVTGG